MAMVNNGGAPHIHLLCPRQGNDEVTILIAEQQVPVAHKR